MGFGDIGRAVARALAPLQLSGTRVDAHAAVGCPDVATFLGARCARRVPGGNARARVPAAVDATRREACSNAPLFAKLPAGAYVINVSRGALLVETDLIEALDAGQLAGAALDVHSREPLPPESALWRHARILVTPHIAAMPRPEVAAAQLLDNLARARRGEPLRTSSTANAATERSHPMHAATLLRLPSFSLRFVPVWRRNLLVWRKLAIASVLGNIAEPLLYMLALGYGIGALIGEIGGMPYIAFIGTGMVCQSAMFTASFEGMYSAFSRMHMQRTWDAIINAPISLDDVVLAEWIWCATKALMSTIAILLVLMALGFGHTALALWILPLGFLIGLTFGAFGLVMNALAPGYDFFTYFFTLVLTPQLLMSGVYFPVDQMPGWLQAVANALPLKHAIDLARPLMLGRVPDAILLHVAVLIAYGFAAYWVALVLTRRRLLK